MARLLGQTTGTTLVALLFSFVAHDRSTAVCLMVGSGFAVVAAIVSSLRLSQPSTLKRKMNPWKRGQRRPERENNGKRLRDSILSSKFWKEKTMKSWKKEYKNDSNFSELHWNIQHIIIRWIRYNFLNFHSSSSRKEAKSWRSPYFEFTLLSSFKISLMNVIF